MLRKTIDTKIELSGKGLHSGEEVRLTIIPVEEKTGIVFVRTDQEERIEINAEVGNVIETKRNTTLGKKGQSIKTVEHVLAALVGAGVTDVIIEVNSGEIPILDGSAEPYFSAIIQSGFKTLSNEIEVLKIDENIYFEDEDSGAAYEILPSDKFKATVMVDFSDTGIQNQFAKLDSLESFEKEIAPSRTFVFMGDLIQLAKADLIKGGSLENAVVIAERAYSSDEITSIQETLGIKDFDINQDKIYSQSGLRFPNEPARHKLLDLVGDLCLLGANVSGHIIAHKPGHTGNIALVKFLKKKLQAQRKLRNKPLYNPAEDPILGVEDIKALLPHRYPFLLVDKIIEKSDSLVVGIKNVTFNEDFFQGHFPGNPVFPGVLQMEALAQTGGILALSGVEDPENWDTYFLKMDNVKFKYKVVPGDTLILKMELLSPIRRGIVHMQGTAYVGNRIVSEGELTAQIIRRS